MNTPAPDSGRSTRDLRARGALIPTGLLVAWLSVGCTIGVQPIEPPSPAEVPTLEAALVERPDDAGLLLRLGAAYVEAGRTADAIGVLERARALPTHPPGVLFYLGLSYEGAERWADARSTYLAYLEVETRADLREAIQNRLPVLRRSQLMAEAREALVQEAVLANQPPRENTVAVFPFRYSGVDPELAPLGRALAQLTVTDLTLTGRITVLERLQVQLLLDEIRLAEEGYVDPATAARSGRLLGAARIVQGSVDGTEARIDLLAAVVPVETGTPGPPVNEGDALREVFAMHKRFVLDLHGALGIQLTEAERDLILQQPTRSLEALLLYGRALEAEDGGDWDLASELYEQALAEDTGFDEAREGRDRTRGAAAGQGTAIGELAGAGHPVLPPGPGAGGGLDPRSGFADVEALIPTPGQRDPAAELLGREGIGSGPTIIDIILRPPGGEE